MTEPAVTLTGVEDIDMSAPTEIDLAKLRALWQYIKGAQHAWVIAAMYALADPEQAMDDMTLDAENLVGFQPIHCLWCHVRYRSQIRHDTCPGLLEISFTCPKCEHTSHNPMDAREGYCGRCHDWTGKPQG